MPFFLSVGFFFRLNSQKYNYQTKGFESFTWAHLSYTLHTYTRAPTFLPQLPSRMRRDRLHSGFVSLTAAWALG